MKILKYLVLFLACGTWLVGLIPPILPALWKEGLVEDGYQYGDLYRLSTLSEFRDPRKQCTDYIPPARTPSTRKVHLYIIGDSFMETGRVRKEDFAVDNFTYVKWADFLHIKLDTTETNVLLLESVERHFRQQLATRLRVLVPDTATFVAKFSTGKFVHRLDDAFKGSFTADRLDGFLFQNDLALRVKEWKSDLNHRFFDRVNPSVTLVNDDKDIVYYMDTDTPEITSAFTPVRPTELDSLVDNLNASRAFADSLGFNHVVLSIIPNKTSVLSPDYGAYNRLIEKVYQHPKMTMPYIDVLPDFRRMGKNSYMKGDSHWTCEGQTLWLNKFNALLIKLVAEPAS